MATVKAMYMLSRLYRVGRGHLENLVKRRLQLSRGKRRKFMMLLIALAIIVNPPRDGSLWVGPRTDAWIQCNDLHSVFREGMV